jgi:hypothetical protein
MRQDFGAEKKVLKPLARNEKSAYLCSPFRLEAGFNGRGNPDRPGGAGQQDRIEGVL